ncbi:hypothetical protein L484_013478 [Morus notabilis]|uniref:Epidermal patterning factor-like protein n=1 Tax=Morus notabilis TaxID=981085 RepID=W9QNQ3_9ROSA|nr:hypothetical protein L484_013478 [Morus notabilis]
MKGKFWSLIIALQIVSWVAATSRPFPSNYGIGVHHSGPSQSPETPQSTSTEGPKSWEEVANMNKVANYKEVSKIGSSPPSCEHKCYGCSPCEAIQVPTTNRHSHLGIQYANYEPENWKCKCGPSFYTP